MNRPWGSQFQTTLTVHGTSGNKGFDNGGQRREQMVNSGILESFYC